MEHITSSALQYRRIAVVDIETVSIDPAVSRGALEALTGRIVCVALLIDDGMQLREHAIAGEDESKILRGFWDIIQPADVLVGHNILEFDAPFIRQRSWICGVRPSRTIDLRRYYTVDVRDTLQLWTNWNSFRKRGVTLDALGAALGCGQKSGHGFDVAQWWAERDLESIKRYCIEDVRLTYRVYCRLMYQQPRTTKLRPKAKTAEISLAEATVWPQKRRVRGESGALSIKALSQDPGNLDRGSLALAARRQKRLGGTNAESREDR